MVTACLTWCPRSIQPGNGDRRVCRHAQAVPLYQVIGDRYCGESPRQPFRRHGIGHKLAERSKSELYVELLPPVNSGRIELLDHPRVFHQLIGLERRTGRGIGDHPRGEHDDCANAAAGVSSWSSPNATR